MHPETVRSVDTFYLLSTSYINSASIVGRQIESTVNTQLSLSFSTRPLRVNSQQSTIISCATGIDIRCAENSTPQRCDFLQTRNIRRIRDQIADFI